MAVDLSAVCDRLFKDFMAPLVLGGQMRPGKPIGGKTALLLTPDRPAHDPDLSSHVQLARVRSARQLAPIDRFEHPTYAEWVLSAMLHDVVQSTHPGFNALFRKSAPNRLLDVVQKTLERVPPPESVGDALSRHTWFKRMFELSRTDIALTWWTGSQTFLGTEPPARLMAWPEIRRVRQDKTPRPLMDLPTSGSPVDPGKFAATVAEFLRRTPLTDLATCTRPSPPFVWTDSAVSLVTSRNGRTLVVRALSRERDAAVDAVLGRATRFLFGQRAFPWLGPILDLLGERLLGEATARLAAAREEPEPLAAGGGQETDLAFARAAGALVARKFIATRGECFSENERKALLGLLGPLAQTPAAREIEQLVGGA
jgi:hypothetical protein